MAATQFSPYTRYVRCRNLEGIFDIDSTRIDSPDRDNRISYVYINGINTQKKDAKQAAAHLSRRVGLSSIVLFYHRNPITNVETQHPQIEPMERPFKDLLLSEFDRLTPISTSKVVIFAHSLGADITYKALSIIIQERGFVPRECIVKAFGPATLINIPGIIATNYIHRNDLVSIGANIPIDQLTTKTIMKLYSSLSLRETMSSFFQQNGMGRETVLHEIDSFLADPDRFASFRSNPLFSIFVNLIQDAIRRRFFLPKNDRMEETTKILQEALKKNYILQGAIDSLVEKLTAQGQDLGLIETVNRAYLAITAVQLATITQEKIAEECSIIIPKLEYEIEIIGFNDKHQIEYEQDFLTFVEECHSIIRSYLSDNKIRVDLEALTLPALSSSSESS